MIELDARLTLGSAQQGFKRLAGRFTNFTPVLGGRVDVLARELIRRQFETSGRASGRGQWPRLTPAYAAQKARDEFGQGQPLMVRTQSLFRALTKRGADGQSLVLTKTTYSLGIGEHAVDPTGKDLYPRFIAAQLGIAPQPERQLIPDPLPQTFIEKVRKAVESYVVEGID